MVTNDLEIIEIKTFQHDFSNEKGILVWVRNNSSYTEIIQEFDYVVENVIFHGETQTLSAGEEKSIKISIVDKEHLTSFGERSSFAPENSGIKALQKLAQNKPDSKLTFETEHGDFIIELEHFKEIAETV